MNWLNFSALLLITCLNSVSARKAHRTSIDKYSDLEATGLSCPERNSCALMKHIKSPITFNDRNCECDVRCTLYHDCCIDHPPVVWMKMPQMLSVTCVAFGGQDTTGVFMVNKCHRDYKGPLELKRNCERGNNMSDPLVAAPSTDAAKGITYRNRYCAKCNGASSKELSSWIIRVSCEDLVNDHNVSEDYIISNIEYRSKRRAWGVNHLDKNGKLEFYQCDIIFDLPQHLANRVRLCRYNAISTCPSSWRREQVKKMCESYTAVVYHLDSVYKNPHCAICNDVSVDVTSCDLGIVSRRKQPLSFALLLDVNRGDGDVVGVSRDVTPSCASNRKYDPFVRVCRDLSCVLPGYSMLNGRCVRS